MKKIAFFLAIAVMLCKIIVLSPGCANQVPPMGGPRDSLPPVLLQAVPPDSVINFQGKRITLYFDEYVQVDNVQQNLLASPTPQVTPGVEARLRSVVVTIRDTLEPNTTYTLDFGNAIRDINESNILRNFSYVFSTGPTLDSGTVSGKVILAETGGVDSTLIVMLHRNLEDSAVIKERPRYVARLDSTGSFRFRNLAPGTYALYALDDEGGQRRYQSKNQLFAYVDSAITVPQRGRTPVLRAYVEGEEEEEPVRTRQTGPSLTPQDRRLRYQSTISNGQLGLLDTLILTFQPTPLRRFDSTLAVLTNDSFEVEQGYSWRLDTSGKRLALFHRWQENTAYNLVLDSAFAEDTLGKKLARNDTISFFTKRTSDYGVVRFRFINLDMSKNPILLFVQNNEVTYTHVFTNRDFNSALFEPGDYQLRIVYDMNRNGRWDPGSFFGEKRQPEEVLPIERKVTIKANWENETDFTL